MEWTNERLREGRDEWTKLGSSNAAATILRERWGEPGLTGARLRVALATHGHRLDAPPVANELAEVIAERVTPRAEVAPTERPQQTVQHVAILADLHIPQHDEAALECALSWISSEQPAVIVLAGDVGEWESSRTAVEAVDIEGGQCVWGRRVYGRAEVRAA